MTLVGQGLANATFWYGRRDGDLTRESEAAPEEDGRKRSMDEALEENKHREVYNQERNALNFTDVRAIAIKSCPWVKLTNHRMLKEEAEFTIRDNMVERDLRKHMKAMVQPTNMTPSSTRGWE